MKLKRILPYSHTLMEKAASNGDIVVDGTVGNGNDTVFLAKLVGPTGKVYGFDIQKEAIERTKKRLQEEQLTDNVELFQAGHENIKKYIPKHFHGHVKGAIFNLGYLPKGDHRVITKPETTIQALEQLLDIMTVEGIIVFVVYHGHPGGDVEKEALVDYVKNIDQQKAHVLCYQFLNQRNNPPFIIAVEKRR